MIHDGQSSLRPIAGHPAPDPNRSSTLAARRAGWFSLLFLLGLAALAAGALSTPQVPAAGQERPQATAQQTPRGRTSSCQGSGTTQVLTPTLRTCEQSEIAVRAEAVCPVCPAGVNVIFVVPEWAHDRDWVRSEAFGVLDVLYSWSRNEYLETDVRVGVVGYNEQYRGARTRLRLTENIPAARSGVSMPLRPDPYFGCGPLLGDIDSAVGLVLRQLRDVHRTANLGDDDRTCDYVVLFIEGTGPEGTCALFSTGEIRARAIRAAKGLEREVDLLLVGCPGEESEHCEGPRLIPSNRRNYSEAPRLGVLPGRVDEEIDKLVDPKLLRDVTIRQALPAEIRYVDNSAIPTPGMVNVTADGTRLEWTWSKVRVEGEHNVRYHVAPAEATGVFTVTGSLGIVDDSNFRRDVTLPPAPLNVFEPCIPPATDTPTPAPSPTPSATSTATTTPTATSTATSTATATRKPAPLFLPLVLNERCDKTRRAADVVLIIDASTSMLADSGTGRSKLEAGLAAARTFLDELNLTVGHDRAAIVAFNSKARLLQPLTADRNALETALASITVAQQTCLPCAIEVGMQALGPDTPPSRVRTLILLTDGRSNPRPASEAVALAARAKAAGVLIFTVGLGNELDLVALEAIASEPGFFFRSADAHDLEAIYTAIAALIPCPPFWPHGP